MSNLDISTSQLFHIIKRRLKACGLTYRDVASALQVSEISVKRWLAQEDLSVRQLQTLAELLGMTAAELMLEAEEPLLKQLTSAQEQEIVNDERLMLVGACVVRHWTLSEIIETYDMTEAECVRHLLTLDRLRMIDLLPENRIRLRVAGDFASHLGGTFRQFMSQKLKSQFLNSNFDGPYEGFKTFRAMLTPAAIEQFEKYVYRLQTRVEELHKESLNAPFDQRKKFVVLLAYRNWEIDEFAAMRRKPQNED